MKNKFCKSIICILLIIASLVGNVHCFAKSNTADEVNTRIGGIIAFRASSYGVSKEQGIVDYYASHEMTLGGEWYVISFIQNSVKCDYSGYLKSLESYLKNNEVYSATSREKFALTLIALKASDSFSVKYISDVANEAIGKQGIMSLIFGLHLLNNGCKNSEYTADSLAESIFSLQKTDGGWAVSGDKSDVDVTAMALQALYPYRNSHYSKIDKAVGLLSSRQSEDGDFQSYGTYNAESTAQVIIALSSLGINCATDSRFVKNGNSVIDGIEKYSNTDGSYSHKKDDGANNSATFQALNAYVAYSRLLKGNDAFYSFEKYEEHTTAPKTTESQENEKTTNKSGSNTNNGTTVVNGGEKVTETKADPTDNYSETPTTGNASDVSETECETAAENALITTEPTTVKEAENNVLMSKGSVAFTKEFRIKLLIQAAILLAAVLCSIILFVLKKRNKKNFIVIGAAALILIISVFFIRINSADEYYNFSVVKGNITGVVSITVRCETIMGKEDTPNNPVILENTQYNICEGDTVYIILAQALREKGIPFEHNASYYINGIDNLYEFQYGDLSGWMYRVNGETPSVGCGEYVLKDGDKIEWLYTCEIGNDLN